MPRGIILKTPEQVDGIRKAAHLARNSLLMLNGFLKPGVTTLYLDGLVDQYLQDHHAVAATKGYRGYKHATCISPNDVVCHGVPNSYVVKEGDIINVDVTAKLNGYFGDTCTMYALGEISKDAADLLETTKKCLDLGLAQCFAGNLTGNIGHRIGTYAKRKGYGVVSQFLGHGIGLGFHEEPEIYHDAPAGSGVRMKPGMTFTIEPMINAGKPKTRVDKGDGWTARTIDGKLSAQYEHTVLITLTGADVLSDVEGEYTHLLNLMHSDGHLN